MTDDPKTKTKAETGVERNMVSRSAKTAEDASREHIWDTTFDFVSSTLEYRQQPVAFVQGKGQANWEIGQVCRRNNFR